MESQQNIIQLVTRPVICPQGDSDRALEAKRSRAPEVREPVAKRGSSGTPLQLGTNSIILKLKPGAGIWEYHVSFDPQLDKKVSTVNDVFSGDL